MSHHAFVIIENSLIFLFATCYIYFTTGLRGVIINFIPAVPFSSFIFGRKSFFFYLPKACDTRAVKVRNNGKTNATLIASLIKVTVAVSKR